MSQLAFPVFLVAALLATPAVASDSIQFDWNLRLRHESVDDAAFSHDASSDTMRLRAAVRAALGRGWTALVEGEGVASAGNDYNSGANGRVAWPAVTDPSGAEINQAWLGWKGARAGATIGRQRIILDNQRFIGNSGWRQNEQTFDAVSLSFAPMEGVELRYSWLDRVHRIAGDQALDPLARERDLSTHLFNGAYKHGAQQWVAYAYLHHDRDLASASTATYGLRWTGTHAVGSSKLGWSAEFARQADYSDSPLEFAHDYWLLEPSLLAHGLTWKLGWEHLGGNGAHAFQTPLATLHAFNGWADKFTVTPAGGLEDAYLSASAKLGKLTWVAAGHDFRADHGGQHFGREWDVSLAMPLHSGWTGMIKFADYRADSFARDTRKLWLQVEYAGTLPKSGG